MVDVALLAQAGAGVSRADELLAWAAWLEGSGRENVAAALRAHTELLEAAEELLRLRDTPVAWEPDNPYFKAAGEAGRAYDAAWERLRRAVGT